MDLEQQVEYLRALFENFPVGVLVTNDEGEYVDANRAVCDLLGQPREAVIGARFSDFVPPENRDEIERQWLSFLREGKRTGQFEIQLPGGEKRTLHYEAIANIAPGRHCGFMTLENEGPMQPESEDDLLKICAWTRRVRHKGRWISFEQYLEEAHDIRVTHGISADAFPQLDSASPPGESPRPNAD
jgi:PAS domain S-box-containing protein